MDIKLFLQTVTEKGINTNLKNIEVIHENALADGLGCILMPNVLDQKRVYLETIKTEVE
jgi:hypothetical protein